MQNEKPMRILAIDDKQTGCYWYRTKIPMDALRKLGHKIDVIDGNKQEVNLSHYDILHLNRTYSGNIVSVVRQAKQKGLKIVYDCDDALDLIPEHNPAKAIVETQLGNFFFLLREADIITTTTKILAEHFLKYTKSKIEVFPNCINKDEWEKRLQNDGHKLRIGFAGSDTHIKDILEIFPSLKELQKKCNFDFYIFGFSGQETLREHINLRKKAFESSGSIIALDAITTFEKAIGEIKNVKWIPSAPMIHYPRILTSLDLDIGICPLDKNDFNEKKSCIKFYEYAMVNTVVLASNVLPYSEEPMIHVSNAFDWYDKLKSVIENKEYNEVHDQRGWVLENREISKWVKKREELYLNIL